MVSRVEQEVKKITEPFMQITFDTFPDVLLLTNRYWYQYLGAGISIFVLFKYFDTGVSTSLLVSVLGC